MTISNVITSGSVAIDELLKGGFEKDIITTIYGPAGAGKTNMVLVALCEVIKGGGKVIYVDTEGSFSIARVTQILPDFEKYAKQVQFLRPYNFEEQKQAIRKLKAEIQKDPKQHNLVVIDSIAMLYRLEIGKTLDPSFVNKELGIQLGELTEIARKYSIPVLIVNQVYADFDRKDAIRMVGGDLLKYTSKCLIELKQAHKNMRVAQLIKHRSLPEGREIAFRIVDSGIEKATIPASPIHAPREELL
ncbi:MAG: DNA repair protein RadB [Candidatus Woesearchaeota archaeon]|jgi:DNA repair protein RadB